jgi:hypothetical protein
VIIESSIKLKLGCRVRVLRLVFSNNIVSEEYVYGWVRREASLREYIEDCGSPELEYGTSEKYYYYEVRVQESQKDETDKAGT